MQLHLSSCSDPSEGETFGTPCTVYKAVGSILSDVLLPVDSVVKITHFALSIIALGFIYMIVKGT